MTNRWVTLMVIPALAANCACTHRPGADKDAKEYGRAPEEKPKAFGTTLIVVSGDKQAAGIGAPLDQPLVMQVNDAQGAPVAGALVRFTGSGSAVATPDHGLTGPDGQFSANISLGGEKGRYRILISTPVASGPAAQIRVDEIALGYQEMLGAKLSEMYCVRCHESESTPERVSNHDNLSAKPHSFAEGAVLNAITDGDLTAITSHGGPALNKSAEMPPYGNLLTKSDIAALVAYIRAVADPPYPAQGIFYARN